MIWKFTLSSSTFRLIEAAESLSTVDWKLLTEVRLLGLAESFSVGRGKEYRERGVKMGFIRALEERKKILIHKPNVQYQNGYSIFTFFWVDLINLSMLNLKRIFKRGFKEKIYWRFCRERVDTIVER